jgi:hypothetical protein
MRSAWLWPLTIILSAGAAALFTFVFPGTAARPFVDMWFLFVCPGMAVVRLFRLNNAVAEWMLAVALSFALDAIVAGSLLYANRWSPTVTMLILLEFSLAGVIAQVIIYRFTVVLPG